jgi:hypothetical protein
VILALGLAVAVLALVLLLRRDGGAGEVEAGGATHATSAAQATTAAIASPASPSDTAAEAARAAANAANAARAPHDAALHDRQNRYTVRLIQYPDDEKGLALALAAHGWLAQMGYPVGSPIRLGGGKGLVLVAGAKPTSEELVPLRDNLRRLRYPESSRTMPFADAYLDEIDDVLAR